MAGKKVIASRETVRRQIEVRIIHKAINFICNSFENDIFKLYIYFLVSLLCVNKLKCDSKKMKLIA